MRCDFGLSMEGKDFTSTLYLGKIQVRRVEICGYRLEGGLRETEDGACSTSRWARLTQMHRYNSVCSSDSHVQVLTNVKSPKGSREGLNSPDEHGPPAPPLRPWAYAVS